MARKKHRISAIQIITIILMVCYLIWEKNVQQHFQTHPEDADLNRIDLWFILPVLAILIGIVIGQFLKK